MGGPGLDLYTVDQLIECKRKFKGIIESYEEAGKLYGEEIIKRLCESGETRHVTDDGQWVAELVVGRSASKLSEIRLVEAGVSADVIAQSREQGKEYSYVKITRSTSAK